MGGIIHRPVSTYSATTDVGPRPGALILSFAIGQKSYSALFEMSWDEPFELLDRMTNAQF